MPFAKGAQRPPNSGRKKGTPNAVTRAAKVFVGDLCDDPKVQAAVRRRILKGETAGFFRALDKVVPDAPRTLNVNERVEWYTLPVGDEVADD